MLAQRFVGLLPRLDAAAALTLASIRSAAGRLPDAGVLTTVPPLIAPHHSTSMAALIGGGSGLARPGAVSLAHRGVLFLDEAPEWAPHLLDALRTPLEDGTVRLSRAEGTVEYPARFQLVLAANPCPCAPAHDRDCVCPSLLRRRYLGRLSGPLLDRVDLRARMLPITSLATVPEPWESTAQVRSRVIAARAAAAARWAGHGWATNAEVPGPVLRTRFALPAGVVRPLDSALRAGEITARGADRALRVAWTLADLAGRRPARPRARRDRAVLPRSAGGVSPAGAVLRARAYLLRVAEPPAPALLRLIAAVGPVEAAARVRAGAVPESVARETAARRAVERVDDDLAAAHACGARLLTPEDPAWPHWAFTALENAAHGPPDTPDGGRPDAGELPTRGACPPAEHPSRLPAPPTQDAPASGQGTMVSGGVGSGQAPGGGVAGGLADREGAVNGRPPDGGGVGGGVVGGVVGGGVAGGLADRDGA